MCKRKNDACLHLAKKEKTASGIQTHISANLIFNPEQFNCFDMWVRRLNVLYYY